ncbi:MAG: ATP-grasp domain-containing protein [Methyloceanibacter sp.]
MPKNSHPEAASLLIAAVSGRAMAHAARRAGFTPLVADFFVDLDTQAMAQACRQLKGDISGGIRWQNLAPALEALARAAPSPVLGFVYGAGFENRPQLLTKIAEHWPVLGNDAATVARIKAPESFFATLDRLGIPHPKTVTTRPAKDAGWLAKSRGGAGGSHVVPSRRRKAGRRIYYQEQVEGRAISALFVANGERARVLGFSEQWTAPTPQSPWRYAGALRPAALSAVAKGKMAAAVEQASSAFQIKGLASADFLLGETGPLLLEINPRPGATLDIFDSDSPPLLQLHLDAVTRGKLPRLGLKLDGAMASAIVYAPEAVIVPPGMTWPGWAADRPKPGDRIDKSRPICTVCARAATGTRAKQLVEERIINILNALRDLTRGEISGQGRDKGRNRNLSGGLAERQH